MFDYSLLLCTSVRVCSSCEHEEIRFQVLTKVIMESSVLWGITPCSPLKFDRHFGGDMFLWSVDWFLTDYTALYSRRWPLRKKYVVVPYFLGWFSPSYKLPTPIRFRISSRKFLVFVYRCRPALFAVGLNCQIVSYIHIVTWLSVTVDGLWIGNWIYWTLTDHNCK
jgi:hypothetical protein